MSEIAIRDYREADAPSVGRLIADTYAEYNLGFLPVEVQGPLLGPFRHAGSPDREHQEAIDAVIRSEMVFVAEVDGEIVGVLRRRKERLASLFLVDLSSAARYLAHWPSGTAIGMRKPMGAMPTVHNSHICRPNWSSRRPVNTSQIIQGTSEAREK